MFQFRGAVLEFVSNDKGEVNISSRTLWRAISRGRGSNRAKPGDGAPWVISRRHDRVSNAPNDFEFFCYPLLDFTVYGQVLDRTRHGRFYFLRIFRYF